MIPMTSTGRVAVISRMAMIQTASISREMIIIKTPGISRGKISRMARISRGKISKIAHISSIKNQMTKLTAQVLELRR